MKTLKILTIVLYVLPLVIFLVFFSDIPDYIQLHWGITNTKPILQSKYLILLIILPVYPLFYYPIKRIKDRNSKFMFMTIHFASTLLISVLTILIILNSLGYILPVIKIVVGLGICLMLWVVYAAIRTQQSPKIKT